MQTSADRCCKNRRRLWLSWPGWSRSGLGGLKSPGLHPQKHTITTSISEYGRRGLRQIILPLTWSFTLSNSLRLRIPFFNFSMNISGEISNQYQHQWQTRCLCCGLNGWNHNQQIFTFLFVLLSKINNGEKILYQPGYVSYCKMKYLTIPQQKSLRLTLLYPSLPSAELFYRVQQVQHLFGKLRSVMICRDLSYFF